MNLLSKQFLWKLEPCINACMVIKKYAHMHTWTRLVVCESMITNRSVIRLIIQIIVYFISFKLINWRAPEKIDTSNTIKIANNINKGKHIHTYANYRNLQLSKYIISIPALAVFLLCCYFWGLFVFLICFRTKSMLASKNWVF